VLRVVVDTNIFVSSLLGKRGAPAQVIDAWRERRYLLVTSDALIAETLAVLRLPRIQEKYRLLPAEIDRLAYLLAQDGLVVPGEANVLGTVIDPDDEMVLACALDGQADCIVSGDVHLLELSKFADIPIFTVYQFLEMLESDPGA
jgi:putative PIN family toxin of toxin-antitoxin system